MPMLYNLFPTGKKLLEFYLFTTYIFTLLFHYGTSENISLILKDEYENVYENESYEITVFEQNDLSLRNVSVINDSSLNLTEIDSTITEESEDILKWQLNNYLSFRTPDENICVCDLTFNACDINCCCDLDCNDENIKVFRECKPKPFSINENFCHFTDMILKNNTIYQLKKEPISGLFCIVYDNLKRYSRYKEMPALKSKRDFETVLKYHSKSVFSWDFVKKKLTSISTEFKYGDPIYISSSGKEFLWSLPTSCFNGICSCKKKILYLLETSSTCNRYIVNLEDECKNNAALSAETYLNFCVSVQKAFSKNLVTHTKVVSLDEEAPSNLYSMCDFNKINQLLKPVFSRKANVCQNVVNFINFTVYHNGVYGIADIDVSFDYMNITQNYSLSQHFKVDFKWQNVTDTIKKSGNPGYNIGLAVVTGTNSSNTKEEPFRINIQSGGLSVLSRDSRSQCDNQKRRIIKFGKNLKTSCYLKSNFINCNDAQEKIYDLLLGSSRDHIYVGVFGNVNDSNSKDWIEAYHEKPNVLNTDGVCNLITQLKINVPYAAVGTALNPQFKILGLGYHYSDVSCTLPCTDLVLSTSVSFFDVTEPTVSHYPKIPSIKINLPADFFYPFSRSTKEL